MADIAQAVAAAVSRGTLSAAQVGSSSSSVRPRVVVSVQKQQQQGPISISALFGSPLERTPSRSFKARVGRQPIASAAIKEVAVENHVSSFAKLDSVPDGSEEEIKEKLPTLPAPESSISALMSEVANLVKCGFGHAVDYGPVVKEEQKFWLKASAVETVHEKILSYADSKLVDSRDIVELELKYKDHEIIIRKEAQQSPAQSMSVPGPHVMAHTPFLGYALPPPPPAHVAPVPVSSPDPAPTPAAPSHPPMRSPVAGTFYRSPGPGERAFITVGDKVTKGQVVCIVEAMKLMNEIEADQSGTIVEILAEDGKLISIETPLFSIKP